MASGFSCKIKSVHNSILIQLQFYMNLKNYKNLTGIGLRN